MGYRDVCFRIVSFRRVNSISSMIYEFGRPCNWDDDEEYENADEIIEYAKNYIDELMALNCLKAAVYNDAILIDDGNEIVDIYYGFTPICQEYYKNMAVDIETKTVEELTKDLA